MIQNAVEKGLAYTVSLGLLVVFVVLEWLRWHLNIPYSPIVYTIIAVPVLWFGADKIWKIINRVKHLKQGRDGEKTVAQYLAKELGKGYYVFHDVVGNNFNLDHVVVCKRGVFVIETKTYSKRTPDEKIFVKGQKIIINGFRDDKILNQARAGSRWLMDLLSEHTRKNIGVKPVVVFPDWFVDSSQRDKGLDVWVLNHKGLPKFIANEPEKLSEQEQGFIAGFLTHLCKPH